MTSWSWMKGVSVALVEDPIPPVDSNDERPCVKDILERNRQNIEKVRRELLDHPLYDPDKHDDLWIVRFVLSHKKSCKKAAKAAIGTLEFRQRYHLDEKGDIRFHPPFPGDCCPDPAIQRFSKYIGDDTMRFVVPDPRRGVIAYIQYGRIDHHRLSQNVSASDWLAGIIYSTEWSHQWLDYVTRTTGRLTKCIRMINLDGMAITDICYEGLRRDGEAMGQTEHAYPQLLHSIFPVNLPSWVQIPWRVVRLLLPSRVREKIDFINPKENEKERKRVLKFISESNLPKAYGGTSDEWPVEFSVSRGRLPPKVTSMAAWKSISEDEQNCEQSETMSCSDSEAYAAPSSIGKLLLRGHWDMNKNTIHLAL